MYSIYKNKSFTIFNCVVLEIIGARICPINLTISIKICNIIITVFSRGCLVLYVSLVCYKWIHIRIAVLYEFTYFYVFYPLFSSMLIIRRTHVLVNVNPEHSFADTPTAKARWVLIYNIHFQIYSKVYETNEFL